MNTLSDFIYGSAADKISRQDDTRDTTNTQQHKTQDIDSQMGRERMKRSHWELDAVLSTAIAQCILVGGHENTGDKSRDPLLLAWATTSTGQIIKERRRWRVIL